MGVTTLFGFLRRKRKLSDMTLKEVMGVLHSRYPVLVTRGSYDPPAHGCSRWILLRGPFYRDTDYNCSILVDTTMMHDWAVKNTTSVGYSDEQKEIAKDFLPEWFKEVDSEDETVTLLDESMHDVLKDWDLDFITFGWAKVWCPGCKSFTGVFQKVQDEFQSTHDKLKCISFLPEWNCEEGHALRVESNEPIRFF
jgi:hypothetical protein